MSSQSPMATIKATYQPQGSQSFRCSSDIPGWHAPSAQLIKIEVEVPEGYPQPRFSICNNKRFSDSTWYHNIQNGFIFPPDFDNGDPVEGTRDSLYIGTTSDLPADLDGAKEYTVKFYLVEKGTLPSEPSLDDKLDLMRKYAPSVYFAEEEHYYPSTVEFSFDHTERFLKDDKYWVRTKEKLSEPSSILDYFSGDLKGTKLYAFWIKKAGNVCQITYFFFYPYNRGKEIANTIWGNHVGDWEHVTVRLQPDQDGSWNPFEVYLSAHSGGNTKSWKDAPKANDTHPIVFSASGSHAMYFKEGKHTYKSTVVGDLVDVCSKGEQWEAQDHILGYDWATQSGLGGAFWPIWMSDKFDQKGDDPSDPASGPIYRWGNPQEGCIPGNITCRLEDGPTGPVSKEGVWNPNSFEGR